jgi:hypothetical protein
LRLGRFSQLQRTLHIIIGVTEHIPEWGNGRPAVFFLLTNPLRLVPKKKTVVNIKALHHGGIGKVIQMLLGPTAEFISMEHFRELFWQLDDGAISLLHSQLVSALSEAMDRFKDVYGSVGSRLIRIKDATLSATVLQVYDRFEGAYRSFVDDDGVQELFDVMGEIGNALAISEMMDNALLLKRQSCTHSVDFILNRPHGERQESQTPDFFTLFDREFQESQDFFKYVVQRPTDDEVIPPFLFKAIAEIATSIRESSELFDEVAEDLMDLQALTGFTAKWSVLEFIFCLIEAVAVEGSEIPAGQGSVTRFGEGAYLCAATVLCITGQRPLFKAYSIGEKVMAYFETEFSSAAKSGRVRKYITANRLLWSGYQCSIPVLQMIVDLIVKRQ